LHCYEYGREHQEKLEDYCETVRYYKRLSGIKYIFNKLPYIAVTRSSKALLEDLLQDNYPVLFEGLHTTFFLSIKDLNDRIKIVRTHNIEHKYYFHLAQAEKNFFKKMFFLIESKKLERHERILHKANIIAAISKNDTEYFKKKFSNVHYIPVFHPYQDVISKEGTGKYILYHGDLTVRENQKVVFFLIREVFNELQIPFIVAGKDPSKELIHACNKHEYIKLTGNPSESEMNELISNAQINIIPTFQETGMKLKLLASLFIGRHCITNSFTVKNTGLEVLCTIKNTPEVLKEEIKQLFSIPFNKELINLRKEILLQQFSNKKNIEKLKRFFFVN